MRGVGEENIISVGEENIRGVGEETMSVWER